MFPPQPCIPEQWLFKELRLYSSINTLLKQKFKFKLIFRGPFTNQINTHSIIAIQMHQPFDFPSITLILYTLPIFCRSESVIRMKYSKSVENKPAGQLYLYFMHSMKYERNSPLKAVLIRGIYEVIENRWHDKAPTSQSAEFSKFTLGVGLNITSLAVKLRLSQKPWRWGQSAFCLATEFRLFSPYTLILMS